MSNKIQKEKNILYKIKMESNNTFLYLSVKNGKLDYGDKIYVKGEFQKPQGRRNYGGYDYSQYLRTLKIYGTLKSNDIKVVEKNKGNLVLSFANNIFLKIKENINKIMEEKYASIFKGIMLGDTSEIEENIQENFKTSNMSHILAVSGMHIAYIILGISMILGKLFGKRIARITTIVILVFYMLITGFSPSIIRAGTMGIMLIFSKLIFRKNDFWTAISFSLLIILVYNPYLITSVGLQLSYLGTLGIVVFNKNILKFLQGIKIKNRKWKYRFNRKFIFIIGKLKEILAITFSAQIGILPILLYHFNVLGIYFFITNIFISLIIGPIIIVGFILCISSLSLNLISKIFAIAISFGIEGLIKISQISNLPFAKIYFPTPNFFLVLLFYILALIINYIYGCFISKNPTSTNMRFKNLIFLFKYKFKEKRKKYYKIFGIIFILIFIINLVPKNLNIHFVDVGQGDCTFIITPQNKTVLIDGGGSALDTKFDVGKNTLLPYILDRGYNKIDFVIISHFDSDHVRTEFCIY